MRTNERRPTNTRFTNGKPEGSFVAEDRTPKFRPPEVRAQK